MIKEFINAVSKEMQKVLTIEQLKLMESVMFAQTKCLEIKKESNIDNREMINNFISSKSVEGCSKRTLSYYYKTIISVLAIINKDYKFISSEDIRKYLDRYQTENKISKISLDNIRRILSSFFNWLENEDYILKSPVRKIHKIKACKVIKETLNDEMIEKIRQNCNCSRDLAIIDLLFSSGIRVGELVKLNKLDLDLNNRECIVLGKGNKERRIYFDAKSKLNLQIYLSERMDTNEALFVSLLSPFKRLQISGVEIRLRELGRKLGINKVHPHKFRRTLATKAIDKGMPIEQVQHLLGHTKIDTTLQYAMVEDNNVKIAHKKYIS
jgi:site-specific recombinase XerD